MYPTYHRTKAAPTKTPVHSRGGKAKLRSFFGECRVQRLGYLCMIKFSETV